MAEQYSFRKEINGVLYLQYEGRFAKTITGNLNCKAKPRKIKQHADPTNERYVVRILHVYLSYIPAKGRFYRRQLPTKDGTISFSQQPVGVNKLTSYLPEMFKAA